ncbi:hypothetical protein OSTOST_17508, partial [Ostertagia ostertagi]
ILRLRDTTLLSLYEIAFEKVKEELDEEARASRPSKQGPVALAALESVILLEKDGPSGSLITKVTKHSRTCRERWRGPYVNLGSGVARRANLELLAHIEAIIMWQRSTLRRRKTKCHCFQEPWTTLLCKSEGCSYLVWLCYGCCLRAVTPHSRSSTPLNTRNLSSSARLALALRSKMISLAKVAHYGVSAADEEAHLNVEEYGSSSVDRNSSPSHDSESPQLVGVLICPSQVARQTTLQFD